LNLNKIQKSKEIKNMSWKQTRNYKNVITENKETKHCIYVDGQCVEVNQEVYICYSQGDCNKAIAISTGLEEIR
jgi:hypothetical protein